MNDERKADTGTPEAVQPPAGGEPPDGATATAEPAPTPAPRKGRTALIVGAVLVALAALGVAAWLYADTIGAQREAVERLDEATALVEKADTVVLDLDEVVRVEIDDEVGERAESVAGEVPGAIEDLERALELIEAARDDLPEGDVAYALALRDSAEARLEMLEVAGPILDANRQASAALGPSAEAWALVLEAEELSGKAAEEFGKLTQESVKRSTELAEEAGEKVEEARALFSEAATGFPEIDFEPYDEYCEKKLAALELSKQADAAWLDGKIADANEIGTRYNEAEQELAELAAGLPSSPAVLIAEAYERLAEEATQAYFEARSRATAADARLRQTTGQPEPDAGEDEAEPDDAGSGDDETDE